MLKPALEIVSDSWRLYFNNWRKLLPFLIIRFLPNVILSILGILFLYITTYLPSLALATNLIIIMVFAANIILAIWSKTAIIKTANEVLLGQTTPWKTTFSNTSVFIGPVILATVLWFLIIVGGSLLLIIPGLIFAVWYYFFLYAVVLDNMQGMSALSLSRTLVRGRWWRMAWRMVVPTFIFGCLHIIISMVIINLISLIPMPIFIEYTIGSIIATLITTLTLPLFIGANLILYNSAKQNPATPFTPPQL